MWEFTNSHLVLFNFFCRVAHFVFRLSSFSGCFHFLGIFISDVVFIFEVVFIPRLSSHFRSSSFLKSSSLLMLSPCFGSLLRSSLEFSIFGRHKATAPKINLDRSLQMPSFSYSLCLSVFWSQSCLLKLKHLIWSFKKT